MKAGAKLYKFLSSNIAPYFPRAPLVPLPHRYFLLTRVPFGLWVALRRVRHAIFGYGSRAGAPSANGGLKDQLHQHIVENVIPHNESQVWKITRHRTERLLNLLRSMRMVDHATAQILCVGPRNEAEILLFTLYGFPLRNVKSIDLFSYSPLIDVMDMHALKYPDDSFDILYSSYVLRYSSDIRQACHESVRVVKDGGLICVAFVNGAMSNIVGTQLSGGVAELLSYFGNAVRHVYWNEEHNTGNGTTECTVIFSVKK
jgi:hypothetical protein